jgi:hypothetical protein
MSVQLLRGIGVAAALFGLSIFGSIVATIGTVDVAVAQTGVRIDVEGNRRVEADTIRAYFRVGSGERLDASKIDSALKGLYATGLFQDVRITPGVNGRILVTVVENPVIDRVAVRRQQEGEGRAAQPGGAVQAARHLFPLDRAGGRPAHPRSLSAQRPLRRPRGAQDHRTAERPRRSRVRDRRRRQDRRRPRSSSSATRPFPSSASWT